MRSDGAATSSLSGASQLRETEARLFFALMGKIVQLRVAVAAGALLASSQRALPSAEGVAVHLRGADPCKALLALMGTAQKLKRRDSGRGLSDAVAASLEEAVGVASVCFLRLATLLVAWQFNSTPQALRAYVRQLLVDALGAPLSLNSQMQDAAQNADSKPAPSSEANAAAASAAAAHLREDASWLGALVSKWCLEEAALAVTEFYEATHGGGLAVRP